MHGHWEFTKKMTERDRNDRQLNNVREQRESGNPKYYMEDVRYLFLRMLHLATSCSQY
jgi:hypothetical protein